MSVLSEMGIGSAVEIEVSIKGNKMTFTTMIRNTIEKTSKRYGAGIICDQVYSETGKLLTFDNTNVVAKVQNNVDKRQYDFVISACANSKCEPVLYLYSQQDAKPKNFRSNFRVHCGYRANMQIGPNKKTVDGFVHDISFSGISFTYDKNKIRSDIGQSVSATIYDENENDRSYRVSADIVRVQEDFGNDRTLIGAKFHKDNKEINRIVAKCQRKELRIRKDKK